MENAREGLVPVYDGYGNCEWQSPPKPPRTPAEICRELAAEKGYELRQGEDGVQAFGIVDGKRYTQPLTHNRLIYWLKTPKARKLPLPPQPPPPVVVPTDHAPAAPRLIHSRSRRRA